jgi:trehalose-phosphatase
MIARTGVRAGWVGEVAAAYRAGRPLALLFDDDGTLVPLARHPSLARLGPATRGRLARLAALPGVAVGVVSGRPLAEVRAFVGLDGLLYVGSGGLELDLGRGREEYPEAGTFRPTLEAVAAAVAPLLGRFPGTWVERKSAALAVHYRGLTPAAAVRFRAETAAAVGRFTAARHREVSAAIEVTPAGGWDKGTAVERVLDRLGPDVLPVYAGDAATDAEAMAVTALAGGVAVGVGPDAPPTATHRVASAAELEGLLARLVAAVAPARGRARPAGPTVNYEGSGAMIADASWEAMSDPRVLSGPAPNGAGGGPGLLVVGTDPAARRETGGAFVRLGWRVWTAGADDAAAVLGDHAADIRAAVVDLDLPGLQGMRVLSDLARRKPDLVRCGITAEVRPYAVAAFQRLNSSVTLFTKPLDIPKVSATLRWLVGADDRPEPPDDLP